MMASKATNAAAEPIKKKRCVRAWLLDETPFDAFGESAWVFVLSRNPVVLFLGLGTVVLQWMILRSFMIHTDVEVYSVGCDDFGQFVCEEWEMTGGTLAIVFILLFCWTLADVMTGFHFVFSACWVQQKPMRLLLAGMVALGIGSGTLWSAFFYILAATTSDLDALLNVVGILYVMDIDEAVYRSISRLAPHWHARVVNDIRQEFTIALNGTEQDDSGDEDDENKMLSPSQQPPYPPAAYPYAAVPPPPRLPQPQRLESAPPPPPPPHSKSPRRTTPSRPAPPGASPPQQKRRHSHHGGGGPPHRPPPPPSPPRRPPRNPQHEATSNNTNAQTRSDNNRLSI